MKTFVLHDESVNSYGFRMLTAGAVLEEFKKNPVMLYNHDDREMPIGRWDNIRIEDNRILADAHFDELDPRGKEIARKVEAGYINACSIGAWVLESDSDASLYIDGQDSPTVTRWVVREASICNIPSNHNALALYDARGKRVAEDDIPSVLELTDKTTLTIEPKETMIQELKAILSLADNAKEEDALKAIQAQKEQLATLQDEVAKLKAEKQEAEAKALSEKKAHFTSLLDAAMRNGSLSEGQKDNFKKLFDSNPNEVIALLEAMPRRRSVTEQLHDAKQQSAKNELLEMSWDDLDRAGRLQELRDSAPEVYTEKYNQRFHTAL